MFMTEKYHPAESAGENLESHEPAAVNLKDHLEQLRRTSPEEIAEGWYQDECEINGVTIKLQGVAHHPDTLKIAEYKEAIEKSIAESSLVITEGAPIVSKKYTLEELNDLCAKLGLKISKQELQEYSDFVQFHNPYDEFFEQIQHIVALHKKDLATVDPNEDIYASLQLMMDENKLTSLKNKLTLASLATLLGTYGTQKFLSALDRFMKKKVVTGDNPVISRRTFLKMMGVSAAATGLGGLSAVASLNESLGNDRTENQLAAVLYSFNDYREVVVAQAIEQLSKLLKRNTSIATIYGSRHVAGIKHYLEYPVERAARLVLYAPFTGDPNDIIKIYHFETKWEEGRSQK